jgi:hypothetical protein
MNLKKNITYVNGPINYFRLKKNDKDIYLFADLHENKKEQTECDELESINIDKFLMLFFKNNKNLMVDFMLEINKPEKETKIKNHTSNYIINIRNVFNRIYLNNPYYQNLRIHYIDIRNYEYLEQIHVNIQKITKHLQHNEIYDFNLIIENLINISYYLKKLIKYYEKFKNKSYEETKIKNNEEEILFKKTMNKIINKYNNNENKTIINNFLKINYYDKIKYLLDFIEKNKDDIYSYIDVIKQKNKTNKFLIKNKNKKDSKKYLDKYNFFNSKEYYLMKYKIKKNINTLESNFDVIKLTIMDCYFLRRVSDKEYIKNVVVYTGLIHTIEYLYYLVKYFKFEIVSIDSKNFHNILEINDIIKKNNSVYEVIEILLSTQSFSQCIAINNLFS